MPITSTLDNPAGKNQCSWLTISTLPRLKFTLKPHVNRSTAKLPVVSVLPTGGAALPRRWREQKKEIDIGTRRKGRPPVAAHRRDHEGFAGRTVCGRMNIGRHIIENLPDQLVFNMGEMAGAGEATPVGLERFAGERASLVQGGAKKRDRLLAHDVRGLAPRMERRDLGAQACAMEVQAKLSK